MHAPRFRLRTLLIAIALLAWLLYQFIIPTWQYYRLPHSTRLTLTKLECRTRLTVSGPVPLGAFVKALRAATMGPKDNGIPIYVDTNGLANAGAGVQTLVTVPSGSSKLKTTLGGALRPLGLGYYVKDGLLTITSRRAADRAVWEDRSRSRRP